MALTFYNTLTRQKEEFIPIKSGKVGLYTCGPTVYNFVHLGNLRTYIFEDILKRVLYKNNFKVTHVMNITDVGHLTDDADNGEDKMEKGSRRENKSAHEIAAEYTEAFKRDIKDLSISEPDTWCKATDHIKEQVALIKKLEKKGFTYPTKDGIYFDTSKLEDYGKLANLKNQELRAGVRVDIGDKKNTTDFALWKFSPVLEKRQMEWDSPWGVGFPGWHIECSAMATSYLGQPFDIHCGGIDHVPVHHTNEIAQSEAANEKPLANFWLHGEFLLIDNDKMAKSGDNFLTISVLKEKGISPLAYRYFVLQSHYRRQLNFSFAALEAAENGLEHLYKSAVNSTLATEKNGVFREAFIEHINNDLDIPGALALTWEYLKQKTLSQDDLLWADDIFGLQLKEHLAQASLQDSNPLPAAIQELITKRDHARAEKKWSESDTLRHELEAAGYIVHDTKDGTKLTQ